MVPVCCTATSFPTVWTTFTNLTFFFSPVNLLDSYEDRYTYSFAFAATASSIVQVIVNSDFTAILGEGMRDVQNQTPSYVKGKHIIHALRSCLQLFARPRYNRNFLFTMYRILSPSNYSTLKNLSSFRYWHQLLSILCLHFNSSAVARSGNGSDIFWHMVCVYI